MTSYAVFIRNIMLGRKGIDRELLVNAFGQHGAERVQSVLATGNLIFEAEPSRVEDIVRSAQQTIRSASGLHEPFFTRSFGQLRTLADLLPLGSQRFATAYERCVTFVCAGCQLQGNLPFHSPRKDFEVLFIHDLDVVSATWLIADRPGQPGKWIEKQTGSLVTTRNWNTIARLLER